MKSKIAVLGCGLIGASWSALFSAYGHEVAIWDPAGIASDALDRIKQARGQVLAINPDLAGNLGSVLPVACLEEAVADASWIQENVPESLPLKRDLYAEVEAAAPAKAMIASSTSSFVWSELSVNMRLPQRFVTAHPFNPPHLMPLVEIFGETTAQEHAVAFYVCIGRVPVRLKREAAGHIANRLASALWREAVHIVAEGIADVEAVDSALVNGPGLRWSVVGAHMAYHLGGGAGGIIRYLDHLGPSQERRWGTLGNPRLTPEVRKLLTEGVMVEAAGRTVGELEAERDQALIEVLRRMKRRKASRVF
jgi:3-hydroxyacyl-CoA dehydrogenase